MGNILEEITLNNAFVALGDKNKPTHYSKANQSFGSPDVTFVKETLVEKIKSWQIGRDMRSDHLPIIIKVGLEAEKYKLHRNKNWVYKKCNQEKYITKLSKKSIICSAKSTCPRRKRTMGFNGNPWWNEECKKII